MPGALAGALLWLAAAPAWGGGPLPVVTTSTDLKALVEAVGGPRVRVVSLAPPLHDPHSVEVKPGALAELRAAALLVRIGLDHEPWLARPLRAVGDARLLPGGAADLDVSRGIALLDAETPRVRPERGVHVHGFGNPHYWLDPENARPITERIQGALARLSPGDAALFEANRARFLQALGAGLTRWRAAVAPYQGTRVVVAHETWPYFARRFGLTVVAGLEPTPGVPPSAAYLAALTGRMKASGVRLIIAEPSTSASLVAQIAARAEARAVILIPSVGGDPAARDYLSLLAGHPIQSDAAYWYALVFTVGGAALFAASRVHRAPIPQEAGIGIVYAVSAAAAVLVVDRAPQGGEHIKTLLVGSILTVTGREVAQLVLLYGVIGALHLVMRRPLLEISLEPDAARAHGLRLRWWDFFYITFGIVVTSSVRIAGVLLVFSYLIVPAAVAALLTASVPARLLIGWGVGAW